MEGVIAVSIPIFITLIIGVIVSLSIYFRNREKQMLLEKGLSPDEMIKLLNEKKQKDPNAWLKAGVLIIFFGIACSTAAYLGEEHENGALAALSFFFFTGIGCVANYFVSKKVDK